MESLGMINASDRKAELERKKAKLAAIREEKRRKEEERRKQQLADPSSQEPTLSGRSLREETDKILFELGISSVTELSASADAHENAANTSQTDSVLSEGSFGEPHRNALQSLQSTEPIQISFSPRELISYCKSTQTIAEAGDKDPTAMHMFEWDDEFGVHHGRSASASSPEEVFDVDSNPAHIIAGILPHVEMIKPAEVPKEGKASEHVEPQVPPEVVYLREEEKQSVLNSEAMQSFLSRAGVILERAICQQSDIFADYCKGMEQEKLDTSVKLSLNRCYYNEAMMRNRCVTCIDYSVQYPELMAVSYDDTHDSSSESVGLVAIWNSKFKKNTPEYCFHAQSRVLSLSWAKFHPNLLIGGTYSGQICLWDMRQAKRTPIQKSALSTKVHTYPVYCLEVVGSANAHNIVSMSTDGKMCTWSLEMLAEPQETLDLQKQSKPVGPYCMRFSAHDVNNFYVGSDDGCVYSGCRHGSRAGITDVYEGHSGPTVGIDCHRAAGPIDFSRLFLTSSFDWTVKLWTSKEAKPLHSFENNSDYVLDVAWSPTHPALFACVDCTGKLDLWHLNQDTELPIASVQIDGDPALRKVHWAHSGSHVVVGADDGRTLTYDVNEKTAVPNPNEWTMLSKTLYELKQNQIESEELNTRISAR